MQVLKFYDLYIGLAIADSGRIFRTVDAARTWQSYPTSHTGWGNDIEFAPSDPAHVWMTDNQKVHYSSDTGKTWTSQVNAGGRDIVFPTAQNGWFVGDGGNLYHTTNGWITSMKDTYSHTGGFMLYQNYPNPFNPLTNFSFIIPARSFVSLKVFDVMGREVATLVNGELSAGNHTQQWNVANNASGVYFYRLHAGAFTETKKLILLR
jgi:photosystem II stability/assembly factor-like uncharacterized protein